MPTVSEPLGEVAGPAGQGRLPEAPKPASRKDVPNCFCGDARKQPFIPFCIKHFRPVSAGRKLKCNGEFQEYELPADWEQQVATATFSAGEDLKSGVRKFLLELAKKEAPVPE